METVHTMSLSLLFESREKQTFGLGDRNKQPISKNCAHDARDLFEFSKFCACRTKRANDI